MSQADLLRAAERAGDGNSKLDRPAVSRWYHGKERPSVQNTQLLAKAAATHYGQPIEQVHRAMECHDALHQIARGIATAIARGGSEALAWQVMDNAAALALDVLRGTMEWLEQAPIDTDERRALAITIFARGTDQQVPSFSKLTPFLRDRIQDPTRRAYLLRSFGNLDDFLHQIVNSASDLDWHEEQLGKRFGQQGPQLRDLLRKTICGLRDAIVRDGAPVIPDFTSFASNQAKPPGWEGASAALAADAAHRRGVLGPAIDHWRQATSASPDHALYHYKLGAALGKARRGDEALSSLRRAIELQPDWEMPRGEIAVLLLNAGHAAEAEAELRQHLAALGRREPWLLELLGGALGMQLRWQEACECFEESLSLRPNHPETLHHAAKAFFCAGDPRRGLELAKKASDLGRPETLARYQAGEFGGTSKKRGSTPGEEV